MEGRDDAILVGLIIRGLRSLEGWWAVIDD